MSDGQYSLDQPHEPPPSPIGIAGFEKPPRPKMPLQRRVPKRGFRSPVDAPAEVRLDNLNRLEGDVDLAALKAAGVVAREARRAKVIASGEINVAVNLKGVAATAGAVKAIEAAGGSVAE